MATATILGGDFTVYFPGDAAGDKQIRWTGGAAYTDANTHTANELYTALMDLFEDPGGDTIGDYIVSGFGIPMKAVTPRQYQIGAIENDIEPWFIDNETTRHITGGSIEALGWQRTTGSVTGIVRIDITNVDIVAADVGNAITHASGDAGVLLELEVSDRGTFLWVRPDSNSGPDDFDSTGTLTCNGNTATQTSAGSRSGNPLWVNVVTIGSVVSGTDIYVAQDNSVLTQWWESGLFDRLFLVLEPGGVIDNFELMVFARQSFTLYDSFSIMVTAGRNVVPLSTSPDLNNPTPGETAANGITIGFAGPYLFDVDQDTTDENYSISIDGGGNPVKYVYEYLKSVTAEGITTLFAGVEGQQYTGIQDRIDYASETNTINIGDEVVGSTSSAEAFVINKTATYVMLGNVEGTFVAGENLVNGTASLNNISNITAIAPKKQAPFATFAGVRLFCAQGVYLTNVFDANNYELIDDQGNVRFPPETVAFQFTGLEDGTEVRIFQASNSAAIAGVESIVGGVDIGTTATSGVAVGLSDGKNTFTFTYNKGDFVGVGIYVAIINNQYEYVSLSGLELGDTPQSIPVQQRFDRNYSDPN